MSSKNPKHTTVRPADARTYAAKLAAPPHADGEDDAPDEITESLVPIDADEQELVLQAFRESGAAPGTVGAIDRAIFNELIGGDFDIAARIVKLEPGMYIRGILCGESQITVSDPNTGEDRPLRTWLISDERGIKLAVITSHQLEQELQQFVTLPNGTREARPRFGEYVLIARQASVRSSRGRVVSQYMVAFRRHGAAATNAHPATAAGAR